MGTEAAAMAKEAENANEIIHYFAAGMGARSCNTYANHVYDMDYNGDRVSTVLYCF